MEVYPTILKTSFILNGFTAPLRSRHGPLLEPLQKSLQSSLQIISEGFLVKPLGKSQKKFLQKEESMVIFRRKYRIYWNTSRSNGNFPEGTYGGFPGAIFELVSKLRLRSKSSYQSAIKRLFTIRYKTWIMACRMMPISYIIKFLKFGLTEMVTSKDKHGIKHAAFKQDQAEKHELQDLFGQRILSTSQSIVPVTRYTHGKMVNR